MGFNFGMTFDGNEDTEQLSQRLAQIDELISRPSHPSTRQPGFSSTGQATYPCLSSRPTSRTSANGSCLEAANLLQVITSRVASPVQK